MTGAVRILGAVVENFGPFERAEYGLERLGLALVEGRNLDDPVESPHNGVGKSSLYLNAPSWSLFGALPEGADADGVVNDIAGRNCAVTTHLEAEGTGLVTVQRFRKVGGKGGLRFWVGRRVADLADAKSEGHRPFERSHADQRATQGEIEELLGLDHEVWRAAVYRAQDDERRFAALVDSEQKDLLTRVFRLDVIDGWRANAEVRAAELVKSREQIREAVRLLEAENPLLRVQQLEAALAAWSQERSARITALDATLSRLQDAWQTAQAKARRLDEVVRELAQLRASPPRPSRPLEPEPQRPAEPPPPAIAPEPVHPRPAQAMYDPAPPPQQPQVPAAPDQAAAEGEAAGFEASAAQLAERARAGMAAAAALRAKAAGVASRRAGLCSECGVPLTPEHADLEAARLGAEARGLDVQACTDARLGDDAALAARAIRQKLAAERTLHAQRAHAAQEQHRAACAAWEAENRRRQHAASERADRHNAAERARYADEYARWAAERDRLNAARNVESLARWDRWQAELAQVSQRNALLLAESRGDYDARVAALAAELRSLEDAGDELTSVTASGMATRDERNRLAAAAWPLAPDLEAARARADQVRISLSRAEAELAAVEGPLRLAEFWVSGFGARGLKSYVLDERLQELTDLANGWIRLLTGGVYWVRFETQAEKKKGGLTERFTVRVFRHGRTGRVVERRWGMWSGGQKARVGVGIDLALADAIAARARRRYNLMVLDEVFRHLDAGGREGMLRVLAELRKTRESVVVVDHDREFKAAFDRRIVVEMSQERSRLVAA